MNSLRRGTFAGGIAGLVLASLYAVDYGPGANLHTAAKWLALDSRGAGEFIGFVLLIILGVVFGLAFGAFQGYREISLARAIISGLALGVAWFVILVLLLGSLVGHLSPGLYGFMLFVVTSLLFGLIVGTLYYQNLLGRTS